MKPKISQLIHSLAAALLALAVPFAASAAVNFNTARQNACEMLVEDNGGANAVHDAVTPLPDTDGKYSAVGVYTSHWGEMSGWTPYQEHLVPLLAVALKRYVKNTREESTTDLDAAILRGLEYWFRFNETVSDGGMCSPTVCRNWWYRQIGTPRVLASIGVLAWDVLDDDQKSKISSACECKANREYFMESEANRNGGGPLTGQNIIFAAHVRALGALVAEDDDVLNGAVNKVLAQVVLANENNVTVTTGEGLRSDGSYHQHGNQPQFGGYGMSFVHDVSMVLGFVAGTGYELNPEKVGLIESMAEAYSWLLHNDKLDTSSIDRHRRPNSETEYGQGILTSLRRFGIDVAAASFDKTGRGYHYFDQSALSVYRGQNFMASVKMSTSLIRGTECVNLDSRLAAYFADGALFFTVTGDEYENVYPLWKNWHYIPGITVVDKSNEQTNENMYNNAWTTKIGENRYNDSDWGTTTITSDAASNTVTYVFSRRGFNFKKKWEFNESGVNVTVSDVSCNWGESNSVYTCVEHVKAQAGAGIVSQNNEQTVVKNGPVTYTINAPQSRVSVSVANVEGDWYDNKPGDGHRLAAGNILKILVNHGTSDNQIALDNFTYSVNVDAEGVNYWESRASVSPNAWLAGGTPGTVTPPVAHANGNTMTATIAKDGGTATAWNGTVPTEVGSYVITWTVPSDGTLAEISCTASFTVSGNRWTTLPSVSPSMWSVGGTQGTITPPVPYAGTAAATITKDGGAATAWSGATPTEAGNYTITWTVPATAYYEAITASVNFEIRDGLSLMYLIGTDGPGDSSFVSSSAGNDYGWNSNPSATKAETHTVGDSYDYVIPAGKAMRTVASGVLPLTFAGNSLTLENGGKIILKYGDLNRDNISSDVRGDRCTVKFNSLISNDGMIAGTYSDSRPYTISGGTITVAEGKSLTFVATVPSGNTTTYFRDLKVDSAVTGAGTIILNMGWDGSVQKKDGVNVASHKSFLTFAGDMSGFTGKIAGEQVANVNNAYARLYITGAFGGTIESLPPSALGRTIICINYDGLVNGATKGLRVSSTTIPDRLKDSVVFITTADTTAKNLPLMTFPAGTTVSASDFSVKYAASQTGTGTAFENLGVRTNGDSTKTLVANYDGAEPEPPAEPTSIAGAAVAFSPASATYSGSAQQPTVTVTLNNVDITSSCTITWDKTGFINAGTYTPTITASGTDYTGTVSSPGSFVIAKATPAITGTLSMSGWTVGGTESTPSGLSSSFGTVSYVYYTNSGCTSGQTSTRPSSVGTYYVRGEVAASENWNAANSAAVSFTISAAPEPGPTAVNVPMIASVVYTGSKQTAAVPANAGYTVVRNEGGTAVGSYEVELQLNANYKWSDNSTANKVITFAITKATPAITGTLSMPGWTVGGTASTPSGLSSSFGTVSYVYYTNSGCTSGRTSTRPTSAGTYYVRGEVAASENWNAANSAAVSFTISAESATGPDPNHPTWWWESVNDGTLRSSDGWEISHVAYSSRGIMTFYFCDRDKKGYLPHYYGGMSPTVLDFTNLKYASGLSGIGNLYVLNNSASDAYRDSVTSVQKIILPDYITSLGDNAFWYFTELTEVEGLESVKSIGPRAFYMDAKLATLTGAPALSQLSDIRSSVFEGCGLTAISFSGSPLTALPERLFADCTALTSVTLPAGLTSLGEKTFFGCSALSSVNFPSGLSSMGDSCFEGASSLQGTFNSAFLASIPERAFAGAGASLVFKAGAALESVGPAAFSNATGLTKVDLTAATKLTAVADHAFYGCTSLTTIDPMLPDQLTSFGDSAFEGCSAVTGELELDGKGYAFGNRVFYGWDSLTSLVLGTDILNLPDYTFATDGASPKLTYITFSAPDMRELNDNIFTGQSGVKELTLAALHLRTPGQAFAPFENLEIVHWQGAVPYGLTTDPFPNAPKGQITIHVSGASWSRKTEANGAVAPLLIDNLSSGKPQDGQWIFVGTKADPTKYQNTVNADPQTAESSYSVLIGDSTESVKIDDDWLKAKGYDPSTAGKGAIETWLKQCGDKTAQPGDYQNWMAYILGNEPGEKVLITSDAAKDTESGVTIKLGNVADIRDVEAEIPGRPKADECYVSTKFQLMKWDYQNGEYVPEGTPSESSEFTLPFDACTPAARYTVRIAFTADSKTLFVDAVDAVYFYTGTGQTIPVPGVDPADGVSITYSFDRDGTYSATSPTMTDVGETNIYIKATKSGFADASAEAKLTILQADNSWTTEPSISPDSWKDAPAFTDYTLAAVPRFGSGTVEASIDGGAWTPLSLLAIDTAKGVHTIAFNVPETPNYRVLEGSTSYSIGTYYTIHQDSISESAFSSGYWTLNRDGVSSTPGVKPTSGYDYVALRDGMVRTKMGDNTTEVFQGDRLILQGGGKLALKGTGGGQKTVTVSSLVVRGEGMLSQMHEKMKFFIAGSIGIEADSVLLIGSPHANDPREVEIQASVTGEETSSIQFVEGFATSNSGNFFFKLNCDMSGFKGLLASKNPDIKSPLEVYLMSNEKPFGGRIGNLVSNASQLLKLYLSVASVGTSGIPVVSGDALAPESLYLLKSGEGAWAVANVGNNKPVLVYPAGTQLDISRFTNIQSLNPALVTMSDGRVVLMVNCNMPKLTIAAESPAPVTYDGAEHGLADLPTVSPSEAGATLAYLAADGETWTAFDELEDLPTFTEAGDHEIQLRAVADDYQTAFETVSVRINKVTGSWMDEPSIAPTEWTEGERDSLSVFFGIPSLGSDPVDRYAIEGGVKFYAVETLTEHLLGLSAGSYTVMFTAESENPNYAALTKEIPITVIANVPDTPIARPTANNYTYNATERAGVADGEGYTVVNGKQTAVGDYTATVTLATGYCWDSEPAKETLNLPWSIGRAAATVTADDKSKKIGETDPELTATVTGLFGVDTVAYTLSRVAGEDVGTYAITPSGSEVQGNYDVSFVSGTFTINDTKATYYLVGTDANNTSSFKHGGDGAGWTPDGGATVTHDVVAGYDYVIGSNYSVRTPNDATSITFNGDSLTLDNGNVMMKCENVSSQAVTIPSLIVKGGSTGTVAVATGQSNTAKPFTLKGAVVIPENSILKLSVKAGDRNNDARTIKVESVLSGTGTIGLLPYVNGSWTGCSSTIEILGAANGFAGTLTLAEGSGLATKVAIKIDAPFNGTVSGMSALTGGTSRYLYLGAGAINAGGIKVAGSADLPPASVDLTSTAQALAGRFALLSYPAGDAPSLDAFTKLATYGVLSYSTDGDRKVLMLTR